jgi:hypothetical protein
MMENVLGIQFLLQYFINLCGTLHLIKKSVHSPKLSFGNSYFNSLCERCYADLNMLNAM